MTRRALHLSVALVLVAGSGSARAEEGLWPIDAFPAAKVKAAYGVDITKAWLDHVMKASVRLPNGCSASVVSGGGLVLTNNHCVSQCVQGLTTPGHDDYAEGFLAEGAQEEKRCVGLSAEVILSITDVTARIRASEGRSEGAALARAHAEVIQAIQTEACAGRQGLRCQVSEFYRGGQYKLFVYRKYDDVRLVFSPGVSIAFFGAGNEFPPHAFDVAFLRLFDGGKPVATPEHLRWNSAAPRKGEVVFVAGSPRISERQLTVSQLQTERDMAMPYELIQNAERIGRLTRFAEESSENRSRSQYQLDDLTNHSGYVLDLLDTLNDERFFALKTAEEAALRSKAGPAAQAAWNAVAAAEQARRDQTLARDYLVAGPSSKLFGWARTLVRGAAERSKPSPERLPGYSDADLPALERELLEEQSAYPSLEQLELEFWLHAAQKFLGTTDPSTKVLLGQTTPEELSTELARSKLGDVEERRRLWQGGLAAIEASDDPMVRYLRTIEPAARAVETRWDETVTGPETRAAASIAQARLTAYGTSAYPDANRTLRLSYGKIDGLVDHGKQVEPFTTFRGLYERATGHDPYRLSTRWIAAKGSLNLDTVLSMSTTNDGINGNSGSPLLDRNGDVIGAFFGGNDHAMGGDYGYDPELNRAVAVSAAAVAEALTKVYGARRLMAELAPSGT